MQLKASIFTSALALLVQLSQVSSQEVLSSAGAVCNGIQFGILPHPTNCRLYYVCFNSNGNVHRCAPYQVFNPTVSFCVHQSTYRCDGESPATPTATPEPQTTVEPESPAAPTTPSEPSNCPETSWESHFCWNHATPLIDNPVNCTQYIDCELNPARNRDCPDGHVFSEPYQDCFPGSERTCELEPLSPDFCVDRPTGNYPHPYQCNRFITCFQGRPGVESCPPYYVYDAEAQRCIRGDVVECSSLGGR